MVLSLMSSDFKFLLGIRIRLILPGGTGLFNVDINLIRIKMSKREIIINPSYNRISM